MKKKIKTKNFAEILLLLQCFLIFPAASVVAQSQSTQIILKSSGDKPFWVKSDVQPVSESGNFFYITGHGIDNDLKQARKKAKTDIQESLQKESIRVIVFDSTNIKRHETTVDDSSSFSENYDGSTTILTNESGTAYCLTEIEYYWEHTADQTGERFNYYILEQYTTNKTVACDFVQKQGYSFNEVGFRAIIPGWGQLYKTKYYGHQTKAWLMMGSAAVSVAGLVTSQVLFNKNYDEAMKYRGINEDSYQTYKANAADWENTRNIFIGLTAAVWIYNFIDVYTSKGEKRYAQAPLQFIPAIGDNQYLLTCNIKIK